MSIARNQEGAALIYALATITLLMSLGSLFVLNMIAENRQAEAFVGTLQARLAAQAGLEVAVAELRADAQQHFLASPDQAWYYRSASQPSYARVGASDSGEMAAGARYTLKITDTASRICLNDTNPNLSAMLAGLPFLGTKLAEKIVGAKKGNASLARFLPDENYASQDQLKKISGLGTKTFEAIEDFVTVTAYQDPNTTDFYTDVPRSPVNINTAGREVLAAVFQPFLSNTTEARNVADDLMRWQDRRGPNPRPFGTWQDYEAWLKNIRIRLPGISDVEFKNLKDNPNPNRRNAWSKTDAKAKVAKYTTEFCFHSGGIYEIQSTAEALDRRGNPVSHVTISITARIFEIFNQTKREQFRGEDANGNLIFDAGEDCNGNGLFEKPEFLNVTWADNCPVNSRQETAMGYVADYDRVNDALKLGFWDDFEDPAFSYAAWQNRNAANGSSFILENSDSRNQMWEMTNDNELHHASAFLPADARFPQSRYGALELQYFGWRDVAAGMASRSAWWFGNAYYRADVVEDDAQLKSHPEAGHNDVGKLGFRNYTSGTAGCVAYQVYARYPGIHYYAWPQGAQNQLPATIFQHPLGGDWDWLDDNTSRRNPINNDKKNRDGGNPIIQEEDQSPLSRPLIEGQTVNTDGSTYKESFIRFPPRVVFELNPSGPDGNRIGKYVFGAVGGNQYDYYPRRTYHLYAVNRINDLGPDGTGVRLQLSQEKTPGVVEERWYPELSGTYGGEIDTAMGDSGALCLSNNASFPSWDNVRVITPVGEYQSQVIDAGTGNVLWGTIAWTLTLPASADVSHERVSFEPVSYTNLADAQRHTLKNWPQYITQETPPGGEATFAGTIVGSGLGKGQGKGRIEVSGSPIVGEYQGTAGMNSTLAHHGERFLLWKVWLTSERYACNAKDSDPAKDDARLLKETPVLEDVTVTFIPPTKMWGYREGD